MALERTTSPAFGAAVGYFVILWAVQQGYVSTPDQPEAVAFAGAIFTHMFMELRGVIRWIGALLTKMVEKK